MLEMLIGMAAGYIAFTDKGHSIGNSTMKIIEEQAKKVLSKDDVAEITEPEE